eukprot:jgi/Ulvmu1/7139/UM034_0045.1
MIASSSATAQKASGGASRHPGRQARCHATASPPAVITDKVAGYTVKGTVRKRNEDTFHTVVPGLSSDGKIGAYLAVYDGHGGVATSDWLQKNLYEVVTAQWNPSTAEKSIDKAFREADSKLLAPGGWMGMGERGIGGSKCGSTAATACVYQTPEGPKLLASNVGDARVLLSRGGTAMQLSTDHVPDDEEERKRIEKQNPNPRMPLVRYVGKTWRVGGLLALSRAFGDAYMKGSLQFEGISSGSDDYGSGFGVIAEPSQQIIDITAEDSWVVVCSDGLFANEERGGGGGLTNQQIMDICNAATNADPNELATELCKAAQAAGSTDDVTAVVMKLQ